MNMEDYIRQNFNASKVEAVTQNGQVVGYYAQNRSTKNEIYIPVSAVNNSSVGMVSYIPGSGGSNPDANVLRDRIFNNPPNYIVSISAGCGDKNNCIQSGLQMAQGVNANVDRNVTVCFSASGFIGVKRNEELLASNPNIKTAVISCEPYGEGNFNASSAVNLANSQTPIIFAAPDSGFHINMLDLIKNFKSNGLNAYLLETDYSSDPHVKTNRDILSSGILDYILGDASDFDKSKGGGNGWDFIKYDPATGQIIFAAYDEIQGSLAVSIADLEKLFSYDSHTIGKESSQVNDKYSLLKNVGKIGNPELTTFSSKYKVVYDNVNDIRTNIGSNSFVGNLSNQTYRSYEGIPGCIGYYLDTYYDAVGSLLNTLGLETESIMSYAESIVQLDKELAEGHQGELKVKDNSDKVIPLGIEKPTDKQTSDTDTNTNNTNNSNKVGNNYNGNNSNNNSRSNRSGSSGRNSTGGHSNGNSISGNLLGGSGLLGALLGRDVIEELEEDPDLTLEEVGEGPCYDETIEPNEIYEFEDYEGYIYLDENDDTKVTGIKYRYTVDDETKIDTKLEEIKELYKDKEYVKEVVVKDNHIDVIFNDESFKDKEKSSIITEYFENGTLKTVQPETEDVSNQVPEETEEGNDNV